MSSLYRHWCPKNGCGKSVIYEHRGSKGNYSAKYVCQRCFSKFTKEELKMVNTVRKQIKDRCL